MTLYIGTLLLNSLGTESPCVIIQQDGQLHCLVSATCLTPYFINSNPNKVDCSISDILYDNSIYGELTDIQNIQSFKLSNLKPNIQNNRKTANSAEDLSNNVEEIGFNRIHIQNCGNTGNCVDHQQPNSFRGTDFEQNDHLKLDYSPTSSSISLQPDRFNLVENNVDNIQFKEDVTDIHSKDSHSRNTYQSLNNSIYKNMTDSIISLDENRTDIQSKKKDPALRNPCRSTRYNGNTISNGVESIKKCREYNAIKYEQYHGYTRVRPCLLYKITEVESTLRKMFLTQDFKINNNTDRTENELFFQLASTVVIFGTSKYNLLPMLSTLLSFISIPSPGLSVLVVSNPFHHECLRYSWSSGIVSSMLGESPVFLTDARLSPGADGAPVFNSEGGLLGIVICSLYQKQQHAISFSLGLSLNCIFQGVIKPVPQKSPCPSNLSCQIVLVRCGVDWGSGIILDAESGIVLTCAHVVSGKVDDISISYLTETYSATIVFQRATGSAFDLALLSTNCKLKHAQSVVMSPSIPTIGIAVTCAGYPVFNEHAISPRSVTLSRGILSKLYQNLLPEDYFESCSRSQNSNDHQTLPQNSLAHSGGNISNLTEQCVMIQTSCIVESGISGGALLDSAGSLMGVIVCNVTDHSVVYPHVNMAVPICTIYPILAAYLRTKDPSILGKLNVFHNRTKQTWDFEPMRSKL